MPPSAMLPETLPGAFGVKSTLKLALCPGLRLSGSVRPLIVKTELLADAWVTVTAEPPELVIDTFCV